MKHLSKIVLKNRTVSLPNLSAWCEALVMSQSSFTSVQKICILPDEQQRFVPCKVYYRPEDLLTWICQSSFRIPYHCRFSMGHLKNGPYTYTVSGGNGRVF